MQGWYQEHHNTVNWLHFVQGNDFIRNPSKIQKITKNQHKKRTKNATACLVHDSSETFEFQSVPESVFIIKKGAALSTWQLKSSLL